MMFACIVCPWGEIRANQCLINPYMLFFTTSNARRLMRTMRIICSGRSIVVGKGCWWLLGCSFRLLLQVKLALTCQRSGTAWAAWGESSEQGQGGRVSALLPVPTPRHQLELPPSSSGSPAIQKEESDRCYRILTVGTFYLVCLGWGQASIFCYWN